MAKLAGLPQDTPLQAFEEVKWEPTVMIEALKPEAVLHQVSGAALCCRNADPITALLKQMAGSRVVAMLQRCGRDRLGVSLLRCLDGFSTV
jgi:hypothetical protein